MKLLTRTKPLPTPKSYIFATLYASLKQLNVFHIYLIAHVFLLPAQCFNLDTRVPVFKRGTPNSYFGFSVAEHVTINGRTSQHEPVLLVGAPKTVVNGVRTGAVYRCLLNTRSDDCNNLYVEPDNSTNFANTDKNDQWLGVTVKSQGEGGYVMACAHRYVHKGDDFRWGNGICYSLSQYLDYNRTYEPCRNREVARAHEEFGFCQAGTSGEISKNFEILIGSPGPYTWRGTIFANNIRHSIKDDKTWYMGPVIESASPVSKYSYLGMSIAVGDFFENTKLSYASGAPRSNGTGQVIFYTRNPGKNLFDLRGILNGQQFASSFGYSMTALDCDGDGHSDLAIGAPFYYSRDKGGAVYVILNRDLRQGKFSNYIILNGKPESRFGFALTNASDLNKDGFEDLAVGAPYENNGVVYIYLGSPSGTKTEPSQIIEAKKLPYPVNVKTFGYSLSGNLDLDRNTYPDLLVGAYESDAVLLLRARPIIKIKTSVKGNLTQIDPQSKNCRDDPSSKTACFTVQPCFKILGNAKVHSLNYRIEAETFSGKKSYRAIFRAPINVDTPNIVERNISLGYNLNQEFCSKELIYINTLLDIQNPVPFKLSVSLIQSVPQFPEEGDQLPDINDYPILDQQEAQRIFYARFLKECGTDDICESNLIIRGHIMGAKRKTGDNYHLTLYNDTIVFDTHVINNAEPAYDPELIIEHSSSISYIGRTISGTNQIECKPEFGSGKNISLVKCSLSNPFKGRLNLQIRFGVSKLLTENRFFLSARVNTTSKDKTEQDNEITFDTTVSKKAELTLGGTSLDETVRFGGEVVGEAAMRYEEQIGNKVVHVYSIKNSGPWAVRMVTVEIHWPYQRSNLHEFGKWVLYLTGKPSVTNGFCKIDPRYINPKKFMTEEDQFINYEYKNRPKRSSEKIKEIRELDGTVHNVAVLSCESGAKCIKFECVIDNLLANHTESIRIPSRLWNATFVEDFSNMHYVSIKSFAKINLNPLYNIEQSTKDDIFSIETRAYPDTSQHVPQASWWWYLLGILIGLIVLILIIVILYKTGFFKRQKYTPVEADDIDQ